MNHVCSPLLLGHRCVVRTMVAVSTLCLLIGCGPEAKPSASPASVATLDSIPAVRVSAVEPQTWPLSIRAQGSLVGDENAVIGAEVAGVVADVQVDLGSVVHEGDRLVALNTEEFDILIKQVEARLLEARAAVGLKPGLGVDTLDPKQAPPVVLERALREEAQTNLERAQQLVSRNALTTEDLEQREVLLRVAEARYRSALNGVDEKIAVIGFREAELALARQNRAKAIVSAPFDGVVLERLVTRGSYVHVGQSLVTLVRTDPLRFRCGVPERKALNVKIDQPVRVHIEGFDHPLASRITRISPSLDVASRALIIEADVPNADGRLRSGLFGEAEIVIDADASTTAVPRNSVVEFAGVEKVLAVREGEAIEQRVRTGRRNAEFIEILSGIEAGETVVSDARSVKPGPIQPAADEVVAIGVGDAAE